MQSPYDYKIGFDEADNRWKKKIEGIKAEIEQRIEMFVSAGDFGNAVTVRSILDIIDKHTQ